MKNKNLKKLSIFLLPSMIFAIIFLFYPIINTVISSFMFNGKFVGFENYKYLFTSEPDFSMAFLNTIKYTIVVTSFEMLIALVIAFFLSQKIKFKNTFQTIFFLPYVTSIVAIGAVFRYMYHSQYGIINQLFNIETGWLTDPKFVIWALIILGVWKGLAFNILILFTGLSTTSEEVEKAALIDGFSKIGIFTRIKLPQITPILTYLLVMNIIFNIKVYEEVVALFPTESGGFTSAKTFVYLLQDKITADPELAATMAVILLVLVVTLKLSFDLSKKLLKRRKKGGM